MRFLIPLLMLASLGLAGCSSNPNAIEPADLPDFERLWKSDRLWSRGVGDGIDKQFLMLVPAISGSSIYAADARGRVYAFDRQRGKRQWKVKTGEPLTGGLAAGYGLVVFGTGNGELVALSAEDGSERWRASLSSEVLAPVAIGASKVVVQTQDGRVTALSLDAGEVLWAWETTVPVLTLRGTSTPLMVDDRVYVGFASGKVAALDLSSGVALWESRVAEPSGRDELDRIIDIDGNIIVESGGVFAATFQGKLAVLDEASGRTFWDKSISAFRPMVSDAGVLYLVDELSRIHAIDQRSGNSRWVLDSYYGRDLVGVAIQQGLLVTGDAEGYLHWIDPIDGRIVSRRRFDRDGFAGPLVVRDDVVYAQSADGKLTAYAIKPRKGARGQQQADAE